MDSESSEFPNFNRLSTELMTLDFDKIAYIVNQNAEFYKKEQIANNITYILKFLCGSHTLLQYNHTREFAISSLPTLSVQGDRRDPNCVVVHDVNLLFQGARRLLLTNITI